MAKQTINEFKSEAQRRLFQTLVKAGKVSQSEYDRINGNTGDKKLPEHVGK